MTLPFPFPGVVMRTRAALIATILLTATACLRESPTAAPATLKFGGQLDERFRAGCIEALGKQAEKYLSAEGVMREFRGHAGEIRTIREADGLCRHHFGLGGSQGTECAERVAVLVGLLESNLGQGPCRSAM